jgi:hypothetical protein
LIKALWNTSLPTVTVPEPLLMSPRQSTLPFRAVIFASAFRFCFWSGDLDATRSQLQPGQTGCNADANLRPVLID